MGWWMIEYDEKDVESYVFMKKITDEFNTLIIAAGGGPAGCGFYCNDEVSADNMRFYINPEGASIPGVRDLLSRYSAKECSKPTEPCAILAGNNAEVLHGEESGE